MSVMTRLIDEITHEARESGKVQSPGPAYDALCRVFPLKAFGSNREHALALNIAAKVTEYLLSRERGGPGLKKQLSAYLETLGVLIESYERKRYPAAGKGVSGSQMLEYLMEEHSVKQVDLKDELGGQSIVSAVLSGRRKLNARQIAALSRRFQVSPSVFFDS